MSKCNNQNPHDDPVKSMIYDRLWLAGVPESDLLSDFERWIEAYLYTGGYVTRLVIPPLEVKDMVASGRLMISLPHRSGRKTAFDLAMDGIRRTIAKSDHHTQETLDMCEDIILEIKENG